MVEVRLLRVERLCWVIWVPPQWNYKYLFERKAEKDLKMIM